MSLPPDVSRSLTRRLFDGELPSPVYAVVGLVDEVGEQTRQVVTAALRTPRTLTGTAGQRYAHWVRRGQTRSVEVATERAVRDKVSRWEDKVAPAAARATVRINERRRRWAGSRAAERAAAARDRARAAADRFNEMNAPVLMDEDLD